MALISLWISPHVILESVQPGIVLCLLQPQPTELMWQVFSDMAHVLIELTPSRDPQPYALSSQPKRGQSRIMDIYSQSYSWFSFPLLMLLCDSH